MKFVGLGPALALVLVVAPRPTSAAPRADGRPPEAPLVVAQIPVAGHAPAALSGGTLRAEMGEGGRLVLVSPRGKPRVLTASFHSAADPEVSFDGQSILFAGKKAAADPWCVFEMKADGTSARQVTCGKAGARQPVYQSTAYTITPTNVEPWVQVAFVGVNPGERNEAGVAPNTSLWSCKTDGTALRRLTYNLSNDQDPVVLPDGRLVYAGWLRHSGDHGLVAVGWEPQVLVDDWLRRYSDSWAFVEQGYPAILAIEDDGDFNPYYHTLSDRLSTLDMAYYAEFVRAAVATVAHAGCFPVGGLEGQVRDALTEAAIPGAVVTLADSFGISYTVTSGATGTYGLEAMAGSYTVRVSAPGYLPVAAGGTVVPTGTVATLDLVLAHPVSRTALFWGRLLALVVAIGISARAAKRAVAAARARGIPAGLFRPITLWPFPEDALRAAAARARVVLVPELNAGQLVLEVERVLRGHRVVGLNRYDGEPIAPAQIEARIGQLAQEAG